MNKELFITLLSKKLRNDISACELKELEALIASDEVSGKIDKELAAYFQPKEASVAKRGKLDEIWTRIETGEEPVIQDNNNQGPIRSLRWVLKIAALFIIVTGLGYAAVKFFQERNTDSAFLDITTQEDTLFRKLEDGSTVLLNKNSAVRYNKNFGITERKIILKGEAFFDVAANKKIPLKIQAGNIIIEVKGTAFNVNAYQPGKITQIALVRGVIEVTNKLNKHQRVTLLPDQRLIVKENQESDFSYTVFNNTGPVWGELKESDTLTFKKEKLSDLAIKLEKKYQVTIDIKNEVLKQKRFSGTFTTQTIDEVMKSLSISFPFKYTIKQAKIIVE